MSGVLTTGLLAALAFAPDEAGIEHAPIACAVADRHVVVSARTPAPPGRLQVRFRVPGESHWYAIDMRPEGGAWTARLPRVTRDRFEYQILLQGPTLDAPSVTASHLVDVVGDPAACSTSSVAAVDSQILVHVPDGAPLVPPVPPGFSPVGVLAVSEVEEGGRSKLLLAAAAVVPLGVGAAAVAASSSGGSTPKAEPVADPRFKVGALQPPGGPLSLTGARLVWTVDLDHPTRVPVFYGWTLDLLVGSTRCATMTGFFQAAGTNQRTLTGLLRATCPLSFEADAVRVTITLGNDPVHEVTLPASYQVGP
jgi:hypothetical protein